MFLRGNFLEEIPYDPNLSHLFQGEEVLFSARLWTHGYDFYTPNKKICWHSYGRSDKPKYWSDHSDSASCRQKAEKRVSFLLGIDPKESVTEEFLRDIHYYGIGKARNLDDYWLASGVDFSKDGKDGILNNCKQKKHG